jgi:hypothetical protein
MSGKFRPNEPGDENVTRVYYSEQKNDFRR